MRPKAGILFFLIAVLFTALSCSNKWEHRLSEKEIETMLKELYIAQNLNSFRAPEDENDTAAYVRWVCREMQIPDCCRLDLSDKGTMCALVDAMCYMENGERIPMEDIEAGWELM